MASQAPACDVFRSRVRLPPLLTVQVVLWMDEILHHFETMGNHCSLAFTVELSFQRFSAGAGFRPSTVSPTAPGHFATLPESCAKPPLIAYLSRDRLACSCRGRRNLKRAPLKRIWSSRFYWGPPGLAEHFHVNGMQQSQSQNWFHTMGCLRVPPFLGVLQKTQQAIHHFSGTCLPVYFELIRHQ